jgi:hypothetical protein
MAGQVSADDIYSHLTGNLDGVVYDDAGEVVIARVWTDFSDGTVVAAEPDSYPEVILGRFRVTVEKVDGES